MTFLIMPSMRKGKVPPFYDLGEMPFQDFCRDLLAELGNYTDSRIFGTRGQKQSGIDIRCKLKDGSIHVAQCKCYQKFDETNIKTASDEFLIYIDYWKDKGVKRFILIVACNVETTQAVNQIDIEANRFKENGMEYDLWDASDLRSKLRNHPEVISTHFHRADEWISEICGDQYKSPLSTQTSFGINIINDALLTGVNDLSSIITSKAANELEENRKLWREGQGKSVIEWINKIRTSGKEWEVISSETQGKIIRLEAIIQIDYYENFVKAEQLLTEAKAIDPNGFDLRIRAVLTLHKLGTQTAIETIGDAQDIDSICLKASLLLQIGRASEAIALLEPFQDQNNPELFRVLSIAYLEARDLKRAIDSIERAKKLDERSESVQIADAVILYFSALSPAVIPEIVLAWPVPIELDLIKSTDTAIEALEKASTIFLKISQNDYKTEADKFSLQIWHTACLACDFRKQKEAEELFSELLAKHPTDHRIISWIVVRKYSVNLQKSRTELKKLREKGTAITTDIISTIMLNFYDQHTRNSLYTLDSNKKVFIKENNEHLWEYWYIQTLIAQKKFIEARKKLEESVYHTELEPVKLLLLSRESQISGNDQPFIDHIINLLSHGDQPLYLLELCHYYATKQEWKLIAQYADNLVFGIQTLEAFRLSSFSIFKEAKFQECKTFIDKYKSLCFENKLPDDINLIYIQSKALSGKFLEALTDLRQITENNPSKQNLALLFDFYTQKGDQAGLRYVMTLAKEEAKIPPDDLISYANSMLWASREMAEDLWRMAPTNQLSAHKIAEKMALAFALGFDHEIKDINNLLPQIVSEKDSPIWQVTQEEVVAISYKNYRRVNELFQLFSIGEIPTCHVFTNNNGLNLFVFYKNTISYNGDPKTPVSKKIPLFIRYGGKPSLTDFKEPELPFEVNHFSIDITSLILLDHFSILDLLEKEELPIQIPNGTVLVLEQMKDDLERYQPEVTRACRLISDYLVAKKIRAIEEKTIHIDKSTSEGESFLNFISNLGEAEGCIIGYGTQLPVWNSLNNHQKNFQFVTCADVIESLRINDVITESEKIVGLDRLGPDGQIRTGQVIPNKTDLYFMANTITTIAQTEVLNQICNNYSVWIEGNEVVRIHASIKDERERQTLGSKLLNLINRISHGLDENKYIFLPYLMPNNNDKKTDPNNLLFHNLMENINAGQELNSCVVVDDFYIQKFFHFQGGSIYGVYEIVWWLHKRGIIDESRYFNILNEFRKADLRYIPVSSDEILFHLKQAVIENNELSESPKLKTLRSYISASLILGKKPQVPSQPFDNKESLGEFEFLLSLTHSASYAVTKIWMDDISEAQKQIKSAWIIDNLFLDLLTISEIVGWERDKKDHLFLVSLSISEFFLNGMQFKFNGQKNSYRRSYYWWVFNVICEPLFRSNPGLLEKTADRIKISLSSQISDHTESKFDQVVRAICSQLYNDLPDPIKNIIEQDKEFLKNIGIEIINVIQLADILFPSHIFWDQLAKVISGESVVIHAVEPKSDILFSPSVVENKLAVTFSHPKTKQYFNIESKDFTFLLNESHANWIDENKNCFSELSRQELQAQVNRITSSRTPVEKFELLDLLKKESIGNYYSNLQDELVKTQALDFSHLLPPSEQSLKRFFGLEGNKNKMIKINHLVDMAAKKIMGVLGLSSAIIRISSFPIDIPSYLLAEIRKLSIIEREDLFSDLSINMVTPISRIHLIRILIDYEEEKERITDLINSFFSDTVKDEITAFSLFLTWFTEELNDLPGTENWSNYYKILLTWGHTDQIFKILANSSVPFDWLCNILKEKNASIRSKYLFSKKPLIWEDVLYGEKLDSLSFKILGLGYALNNCKKLSPEIQDKLLTEIFPWEENILLPALDLMKYHSDGANMLNSFLGLELADVLQTLVTKEDDRISTLNSPALKNLASLAIDWLSDPESSINGWQILFGIFHNQVLTEDLLKSFENNVKKFNFKDLAISHPTIGFIGFYFSTYQAVHLSESTRNNLKVQLCSLAEVGSRLPYEIEKADKHSMDKNDAVALLLESSFQLSMGQDEGKMIEEFSSMTNNIITNWEDARFITLRLINRLIKEVPVPSAQKLGKILLELRSKK